MMKTNRLFLMLALFFAGNFLSNSYAQKNLEAWVKRCEKTKEGVESTYMSTKDPKTKKLVKQMVTLEINNQGLIYDLLDACRKDKNEAYKVMEKNKNGKTYPSIYEFYDNASKSGIKYIFNFDKDEKSADVVVTSGDISTQFNNFFNGTFNQIFELKGLENLKNLKELKGLKSLKNMEGWKGLEEWKSENGHAYKELFLPNGRKLKIISFNPEIAYNQSDKRQN